MKKIKFDISKFIPKLGSKTKKSEKKDKKKSSFFSKKTPRVVTLIGNQMYIKENNIIVKDDIHPIKGTITSTVSFKDVINVSFKLSRALLEDELLMEAEKYVYEQNILDMTKEYQIIYEFQTYEEFYYVDAFAIEVEKLKSLMGRYLNDFKYIDFISFSPFAFSEFYSITNITPKTDVFIYFGQDDSYVIGFKEGKFVFIRALDKFSILERELNKSTKEIIEILKVKGLDKNRYDDEYTYEIIDTFFSKFFMKINNVINYSINFFRLDRVNRIYFYSPFEIAGLMENYKEFWSLSNIDFRKYSVSEDYNSFEYSVAVYNSNHFEEEILNFSIFKKPPPFYKRDSGKLILLTLGLTSFIALDAAYKYYQISQINSEITLFKQRASTYKRKLKKIKFDIKMYETKIKSSKKDLEKLTKETDKIYSKIEQLYKVYNTPVFTNEYVHIISLLKKYNLKIYEFHKKSEKFSVTVLASQAVYDNIPLFLNDLRKVGFKNVSVNLIENNSTAYKTKVMFDE